MTLHASADPVSDMWHRVDVRSYTALARTRVSLIGALDERAIESIDAAVQRANENGHALTFELGEMSSISPDALAALLARGRPTRPGRIG